MAYTKHNYQSGDVLMASELNEMDDAIEALDQETTQLKEDIIQTAGVVEEMECELTDEVKTALLACFTRVAWIGDDGQTYYDALSNALNRSRVISSISAIFTQGSATIYDTDELYALKQYLTVTVTYSDGTTKEVNNYTLSGQLVAGTSTITVAYNKKTTVFNVTVTHQAKTLESISATFSSSASITTDNVLDDLRPYLTVSATYADSTTSTITNYSLSGNLNVGTNTITVSYGGKTTTFTVNVTQAAATLQSISAVFNQGSVVIYENSSLESLKPYLTVTARYSDGTTQTVTNYTLSGTLTKGTSTITVSYSGKTATFKVVVTERATLQSITATFTQGSAIIYENSSLNDLKQYLVVTATYSDSTAQTVTDYTLSGTLTAGTSTITVSYGGKTDTFNVTVSEASAEPTYALADATTFNGTSDFIDTGVQLFTSTKSNFTIAYDAVCKPQAGSLTSQRVIFHCMHEASPYSGFVVQYDYSGTNRSIRRIDVNVNSTKSNLIRIGGELDATTDVREKMVVVVDFQNGIATAYANIAGTDYTQSTLISGFDSVDIAETALIGSYQTTTGDKGRFFTGTIYDFKIYDYALTDTEAQAYLQEDHS